MKNISTTIYVKEGRTWNISRTITDSETIYASLAQDLIAKKLNECRYIRSIKRTNNYDGTQSITVFYNNNVKAVYTVAN